MLQKDESTHYIGLVFFILLTFFNSSHSAVHQVLPTLP